MHVGTSAQKNAAQKESSCSVRRESGWQRYEEVAVHASRPREAPEAKLDPTWLRWDQGSVAEAQERQRSEQAAHT